MKRVIDMRLPRYARNDGIMEHARNNSGKIFVYNKKECF